MAMAKIMAKKKTGAQASRKPWCSKPMKADPQPSWKTSRAIPKAAAVDSRLARVPSSAISGAWRATSRSRKPRVRITPMTSGVEESSWFLRSRFSTAAPPTTADAGRSARSRSTVVARAGFDGSTVGTAWMRAWSVPSVGRDRGHRTTDSGVVREDSTGGGCLVLVDDDGEGAGRACAEGPLDLVVADAGAGVLREDLDGRHGGLQADDRGGEGQQDDEGGQPPRQGSLPEAFPPGFERRRAVLTDAHPRQRKLVDLVVELEQDERQQGQRRGQHEDDREHDAAGHRPERRGRDEHHRRQ